MKFWKIDKLIDKLQKEKFVYWSDERCVCLKLDNFIPIFYAKYCPANNDFSFELVEIIGTFFIVATNIGGFSYRFPLSK